METQMRRSSAFRILRQAALRVRATAVPLVGHSLVGDGWAVFTGETPVLRFPF